MRRAYLLSAVWLLLPAASAADSAARYYAEFDPAGLPWRPARK
jgi:hypothetical protein